MSDFIVLHSSHGKTKIGVNLDLVESITGDENPDGGSRLYVTSQEGFIDVNEEFSEVMEVIHGSNEWGKM